MHTSHIQCSRQQLYAALCYGKQVTKACNVASLQLAMFWLLVAYMAVEGITGILLHCEIDSQVSRFYGLDRTTVTSATQKQSKFNFPTLSVFFCRVLSCR